MLECLKMFLYLISAPNSGCKEKTSVPEGYVNFSGHGFYKYHAVPKAWNNARVVCRNEGAHLVVFNSAEEAKFIATLPDKKYDWAFIGIHDMYKEGQWVTIFGEF